MESLLSAIKASDAETVRHLLDSGILNGEDLETKSVSFIIFPAKISLRSYVIVRLF